MVMVISWLDVSDDLSILNWTATLRFVHCLALVKYIRDSSRQRSEGQILGLYTACYHALEERRRTTRIAGEEKEDVRSSSLLLPVCSWMITKQRRSERIEHMSASIIVRELRSETVSDKQYTTAAPNREMEVVAKWGKWKEASCLCRMPSDRLCEWLDGGLTGWRHRDREKQTLNRSTINTMRGNNPVRKVKYCCDDRRAKEVATMIQNSGHILRYCGYHRYTATERAFENRATKGGYPQVESW